MTNQEQQWFDENIRPKLSGDNTDYQIEEFTRIIKEKYPSDGGDVLKALISALVPGEHKDTQTNKEPSGIDEFGNPIF